jgi:hypothetical protein
MFEEALGLATDLGTPAEASRWFLVTKDVNKAGNDQPSFNASIKEPKV